MIYLFGLRWEAYNTERSVFYDTTKPRGQQVVNVNSKIDENLPRINPSGPPDEYAFTEGQAVLPQFCEGTDGVTIYALNAAPHAAVAVNPAATACAAPTSDTLDVSRSITGDQVTFTFTTQNPPVRYAPDDINYGGPITSPYTLSYPNGPRTVYFKDAANSKRQHTFIINVDTGGGGDPDPRPGVKFRSFETSDGGSYDVYYESTPTRRIVRYYNGGGMVERPVVTAAELGYNQGEEITYVCEANNTKVRFLALLERPFATIDIVANSTDCGYEEISPLALVSKAEMAPEASDPIHGKLRLTISGGKQPVAVYIEGATPANVLLNNAGFVEISGVPVGPGVAYIADSSQPALRMEVDFLIPTAAVGGCTDPSALNPTDGATFENGTCQYAPPVVAPRFIVPLLNALRFVVEETPDSCTRFEDADNVLFCHQSRWTQQVRPRYYQKVQQCDTVKLQVLTNYDAVSASIRTLATAAVQATVNFTRVQQLAGAAEPVGVVLSDAAGWTRLDATDGLPENLLRTTRVTLSGGAVGVYRVRETGLDTVTGRRYMVINRPWAVAANVLVSWELTGPGFNVWEGSLSWAGIAEGEYEVLILASSATLGNAVAVSEPVSVAESWEKTVLVEYRNTDNAYGLVFTTGITPRLRVDGSFFRQKTGGALSLHRNSDGSPVVLSSSAQRKIVLDTKRLPDYLHEKLYLAFRLDWLRVNGRRFLSEDAYEVTEAENYPLSNGSIALEQLNWLGAGNGDDTGLIDSGIPEDALIVNDQYLKINI